MKDKYNEFELAEWLHINYEAISKKEDWKTQEKCQVKFEDLPRENVRVMIELAKRIIKEFKNGKIKRY